MSIRATISRILFFFLILLQVAGFYYRITEPVKSYAVETIQADNTADETTVDNSTSASAMSGEVLYIPETLLLPDALLSPIPSFQFGFIEVLACFLFAIFSFYVGSICIRVTPLLFTNSYFHTLFLSVILINAP
jgi:hypothetical protein